ncbi:MAG: NADH-quinone oxidoreductase subunit N [Phycisphaerales bacterium]|nr:MAG: NADH-quinone oxidoreductase subunit N [Phycisphaerales bacterium]
MIEKLALIQPEIVLFITTCVVMVIGLSRTYSVRKACATVSGVGIAIAGVLAIFTPQTDSALLPGLIPYAKTLVAGVGLLLLLLLSGVIDRDLELRVTRGEAFEPARANRGEFYSFFLFSLTGVMLCATADDLIWLFLALELASLPTYVMVAISTPRLRSQEAAVKYFFLGAFGAATFLYGFALIYGATGTTYLSEIRDIIGTDGLGAIGTAGFALALLGIAFKIAAVPMHFYTPDVYEGAATPVAAYLAFAPKAAGFLAFLLLTSTIGWTWGANGDALPDAIRVILWIMAALTMTIGNVLALLQTSVKRMLAYSSVAHSGYMLVGIVVGPGDGSFWQNGLSAMLFYLLCYGFMNMGAFAVLACVERMTGPDGEPIELETLDDIRGLCHTHPVMGWSMVLSALSLLGLPPLLGFMGKLLLVTAGLSGGEYLLVVVLLLNSAVAAFYYLRIVAGAMFEAPDARAGDGVLTTHRGRMIAAVASAASVVVLLPFVGPLVRASQRAVALQPTTAIVTMSEEVSDASPLVRVDDDVTQDR